MDDRLKALIAEVLGIPAASVSRDTRPDTEARWDSLRHINLVVAVEAEYGFAFTDEEIADLSSAGALADIVARRA